MGLKGILGAQTPCPPLQRTERLRQIKMKKVLEMKTPTW